MSKTINIWMRAVMHKENYSVIWSYCSFAPVAGRILLIMAIGPCGVQFGLYSYEWLTKSYNCKAGVRFVNHKYCYRLNWTTQGPVTNKSKLWHNLRKKLDIGYKFSYKKEKQHLCPLRHEMLTVSLTVLLHCPITSMMCTLSFWCSTWAGDNQSHSRILL